MAKVSFKSIRARAAKRKGGDKVLVSLMPGKPNNKALAKLTDDRVLSEMAARIFSAGFVWDLIDKVNQQRLLEKIRLKNIYSGEDSAGRYRLFLSEQSEIAGRVPLRSTASRASCV